MNEDVKHTILIVDDEAVNIRALSQVLLPEYTVYMARDGQTAIETAEDVTPDLILLDVIMPDMSGYEVITELKNCDRTMEIPVIFITGLSGVEDEEKGFLLGAVDYITKPFNDTIVRVRVRQHLQTLRQLRMIKRLGVIDPLTDISNRRGFNERLEIEWAHAVRDKSTLSILMIDIDHFKRYNDTYGHLQGDVLLQAIAGIFRQTLVRSTDYAARWGGEEFAILLPGTNMDGALKIAERIRSNVENTAVPRTDGSDTRVTVSIGVYSQSPQPGDLANDFVTGADRALYTAKESGRNKVCL
jgi:diguanylate cyclase (GGDEF)-like protein